MARKDDLGRAGEQRAVEHCRELGWTILARNWRCDRGELDIVARDGACLVVVEVKTRRRHTFGTPIEAVTPRKLQRLRVLTACYLSRHRHDGDVRIDVIGVTMASDAVIDHVRGVS